LTQQGETVAKPRISEMNFEENLKVCTGAAAGLASLRSMQKAAMKFLILFVAALFPAFTGAASLHPMKIEGSFDLRAQTVSTHDSKVWFDTTPLPTGDAGVGQCAAVCCSSASPLLFARGGTRPSPAGQHGHNELIRY